MTTAQKNYFLAEGFVVGLVKCLACEHRWDAAWQPGTNERELQCELCKAQNSTVLFSDYWKGKTE